MSYKYLHLIWTCIFPIIQSCTRILAITLTQQYNRIFVPIVFCLSEFCVNIFISIVHILSSKNSSKTAPGVNSFLIHEVSRRSLKSIYIWGTSIFIKPNPTILFIFWIYFIIWVIDTKDIFRRSILIVIFNNIIVFSIQMTIRCHGSFIIQC